MYDTKFIERQNYIASDGTSGRDYWVDLAYFPGIVAVWSDKARASTLTGTELKFTSAGSALIPGPGTLRIKYGSGATQQLLQVTSVTGDATNEIKLNVVGVNGAIAAVMAGNTVYPRQ
jgi:hypothetical protein